MRDGGDYLNGNTDIQYAIIMLGSFSHAARDGLASASACLRIQLRVRVAVTARSLLRPTDQPEVLPI